MQSNNATALKNKASPFKKLILKRLFLVPFTKAKVFVTSTPIKEALKTLNNIDHSQALIQQ